MTLERCSCNSMPILTITIPLFTFSDKLISCIQIAKFRCYITGPICILSIWNFDIPPSLATFQRMAERCSHDSYMLHIRHDSIIQAFTLKVKLRIFKSKQLICEI